MKLPFFVVPTGFSIPTNKPLNLYLHVSQFSRPILPFNFLLWSAASASNQPIPGVLKSSHPEISKHHTTDPAIITTLIAMLTDLFASCFGGGTTTALTPDEAVDKVSNMTLFQKSMLKSRLKKRARDEGVRDAEKLSSLAVNAVTDVALEATPQERVAFAAHVLPIANSDFTMI